MSTTKVSVLLSVYNAEDFLKQAIDSVLSQSLTDFELLIFEDKSTDSSAEILKGYADPRIKLFLNAQNRGQTPCLVDGMNLAKGEYVARMDADDICLPNRLQTQVDFLERHPDISLLGSAVAFFDGTGWEAVGYQPVDHDAIKCTLLYGFTMLHPSVMMRKAGFVRHGLNYDPQFQCSQDHDLWTRAIRELRFANIHEPLVRMRKHENQMSQTRLTKMQDESNEVRRRQLSELGVSYNDLELRAFNQAAGGVLAEGETDLRHYEAILLKIFEANLNRAIFNQPILQTLGVRRFRGWCREALVRKQGWGKYYWKSKIRNYDDCSYREKLGLALRSIISV